MTAVAVTPTGGKQPDAIKDDAREVADIWREALKTYKGIVGFDLVQKFSSTTDMIAQGSQEMNNFHKFRHNEKKVDELRSLFAANLDYIEAGAQQLISAATPAFPPAAAIGTAITFMLRACRQVSADYDIVVVFFKDMNAFLQRIVILETRMPKYRAYQNCLMDVFTSFLTMCGFAHKYIELGRFKKWIQSLMFGQDEELGGARQDMDTQLSRLQSATEFAILANTEESKRMETELLANQRTHGQLLEEQRVVLGNLQEKTEQIHSGVVKLIEAFQEQKRMQNHQDGDGGAGGPKAKMGKTTGADKPPSAKRIRNSLPGVEGEIHEYHILEETRVEDTCSWVFTEEEWKEWVRWTAIDPVATEDKDQGKGDELPKEDGQKLLAIVGEPGVGKSHVAATVFDRLWKQASESPDKHTCIAHFYFREQHQSLSNFLSAVITIVNQVAEQSATLCEIISAQYQRDDAEVHVWVWQTLLKVLLAYAFRKEAKHRLLIVLDGIDEMNNLNDFIEFVKFIKEKELRISIVFTTRPEILSRITTGNDSIGSSIPKILVTKEKQAADMKSLVWNRINTLGNLRSFGRYVKQRIADKTEEVSAHMLYAENLLVRFDNLAREGAVLRSLDKALPSTLHELYEESLASVHRVIDLSYQDLLRTVLHLVAFSFRPLLLHEVNSLLDSITGRENFEIQEVLQPLSGFIRVGDPGADAEARARVNAGQGVWMTAVQDLEKSGKDDTSRVYSDASLPVKFRERSMRNFFRSALCSPGEHSDEKNNRGGNLRWTPSEAHRRLFLITAKLATPNKPEDKLKLGGRFHKYATHYCLQHFTKIVPAEHTPAEKGEVLTSAWEIFTNQHNFASMIEWNNSKYTDIFEDKYYEQMPVWADATKAEGVQIGEDVTRWWEELRQNPRKLFLSLGKAHLVRLYKAEDQPSALTRLRGLKNAIEASKSSNLVRHNAVESFPAVWRGIKNIGGDSKTEDTISEKDHDGNQVGRGDSGVEDQHTILADKNFILGVLGLFDIKPTAEGHRVIAELLLKYGHREPAESICKRTLDFIPEDGSANSPLNEFKALVLMAQIQSKRGKKHSAREYVAQYDTPKYLTSEVIPPAVKQTALVTKARIEAKNNEIESACQAYIDAKLANPSKLTPGDILDEEISLFSDPKDVKFFFKTLKRWTSLERLTWLSWDFKDSGLERRDNLIDSAAKAGELDLIIDAYEEGIKYLDNVDAGAPLRCALSRVFSQGLQDLERAKRVLDEALDSGSTGWPYAVTDEHPDELLLEVMDSLTYIMYEMFRKSKDPIEKQKLLDEVVGLANRPLALDVPPISDTDLVCYRLWIAHMQLKMGPSITFQNRLTEQIKVCVAGLRDKVGWNDATNLSQLGRALYFLSTAIPACSEQAELRYVAGVLASARFSRLTKDDEDDGHENDSHSDGSEDGADSDDDESDDEEGAEEGNGNGEKNSDNSSEEPSQTPSDEGDLLKDAEWLCDGACRPNRSYDRWGKQVVFECYTCDYFLCEQCHTAVTKQEATPGRKFCGGDHEFVRLPVKGWGGVKDGKVMLEGYEDGGLAFDDLLTKVEGDLCRKAWDIFWEGV